MAANNAAELESVLCQLGMPESSVIAAAEKRLEELSEASSLWLIPELMEQQNSQHSSARHIAAVLLRKRLTKNWVRLPEELRVAIKSTLAKQVFSEPTPAIAHAIAAAVAVIAKYELKLGNWVELLSGLYEECGSPNQKSREIAMYLMSQLAETASSTLLSNMKKMFELFARAFADESITVATSAAKCLVTLIPELRKAHVSQFREVLPILVGMIQRCVSEGNPMISEFIEVLNEAVESDLPLLSAHLGDIVKCMVYIVSEQSVDEETRGACFDHLTWLFTHKSKSLVKKGLVSEIIVAAARVLSEGIVVQEEDDMVDLQKAVVVLIDAAATSIPPEIILPIVAPIIAEAVANSQPESRHAGYVLLQCVVDGCSNVIRTTEALPQMLQIAVAGVADTDIRVRQRGLVALNKFIEECQPDVCEYHADILTAVISGLDSGHLPVISAACNALESLIDGMGEDIVQYLGPLMNKLKELATLDMDCQRASLSCIAMVAKSSKDSFAPYFDDSIEYILSALSAARIDPLQEAPEDQTGIEILCQLIDSLGCISVCLSDKRHIGKYVPACMEFALAQVQINEPDIRGAIFCLCGSMASVAGDKFVEYLPTVVQHLSRTISIDLELELVGRSNEEEEFDVDTDYVFEKQNAYDVFALLADSLGLHFAPYIAPALNLVTQARSVKPLCDKALGHNTIRKANSACAVALIDATVKCVQAGFHHENLPHLQYTMNFALEIIMHCLSDPVDGQEDVAATGLELLQQHLEVAGNSAFADESQLKNLLSRLCYLLAKDEQDDDDEGEFDNELESETTMLRQTAIDTVVHIAKATGEHFQVYFPQLLTALKPFGAPNMHTALRTAFVGCLAEVTEAQGIFIAQHAPAIFAVLAETIKDDDPTVVSNSAYGIGVLCQAIKELAAPLVPSLLTSLYQHCISRSFDVLAVGDNACAAVARILLFVPNSAVSLEQVFPTLISGVPLKEDFAENAVVISCITTLFRNNYDLTRSYLGQFLDGAMASASTPGQFDDDTRAVFVQFLGWLQHNHPDDFKSAASALPAIGTVLGM